MSSYGAVFKEEREKAKLSQNQLAKKMGFASGQYISNIERDQCFLAAQHYKTFAKHTSKAGARRLADAELEARAKEFRQAALSWDD